MPTKATLPYAGVNVPGSFSLAGFQVTIIGRFWVTAEAKKVWAHIKKHKLQNPKNKREILADDKLQPVFGAKKLDMFQMTKAVNKHLK